MSPIVSIHTHTAQKQIKAAMAQPELEPPNKMNIEPMEDGGSEQERKGEKNDFTAPCVI